MNIRPRYKTFEWQTKSIHDVISYAVHDRIDLSTCSAETEGNHSVVRMEALLHTEEDRSDIFLFRIREMDCHVPVRTFGRGTCYDARVWYELVYSGNRVNQK